MRALNTTGAMENVLFVARAKMCMTAAMLGAVGGQAPLSFLVEAYSWRGALKIVAGIGVLLSLLYILIVRDKKSESNSTAAPFNFSQILKSKQAWLLSVYSGLAFAPVSVFGGLWGVPFLENAYHISAQQAALSVSWIFIGFAVGAPLLGWLSDLMEKRKPIMMFGTLLATFSLITVLYSLTLDAKAISILLFMFGFGASGFFISFAMIRETFPIILTATVLGFMNTFDSICEAVSEPFVGLFLDWGWSGAISNGVNQFSTSGYKWALTLLPIYLIIAFIDLVFIKETNCRSIDNEQH